ncbi:tail fiber protein [Ralstonia phage RS-PI-1]|uniref:Peptidase S74 domain-containing protein n=1 Tax=Ralstonia phage RS-PI-1 TaxID=1958965 RepID=A0A1S6L1B3_9CAUD|nr:tail fiber protein [Ralstonia phage RS-PI-1]AQT27772.1 hypothetical protein [Ralstonia phage RS-PI-1]
MAATELIPWINSAGEGGVRNSMQEYPGTGKNGPFEFNFAGGYIDPAHVKAYRYDPVTALTFPQTLTFIGPNQVRTSDVIPVGQFVVVYRDTPKDAPLVDYSEGAVMDEANLDKSNDQAVFIAAEMLDRFDAINSTSAEAIQRSVLAYNTANDALDLSHQALDASANAVSTANAANSKANAATSTANDAHDIAVGIDGKAQSALDASGNAVSTANAAKSTAEGIDAKATKAMSDAAASVTKANSADANATTALNTANSVSGKADNAVSTANAASSTAGAAQTRANGSLPKNGTEAMGGNIKFASVTVGGAGAVHVNADLGGSFASWNAERQYAVQLDAPNPGSAYGGIRWTQWNSRHLAAIDAYAGGNNGTLPVINFHMGTQASAWSFNQYDITRGAGGTVWGTWNINPAPKRNSYGNMGYVLSDNSSTITINWGGAFNCYVDGYFQGNMWHTGNLDPCTNARASDLYNINQSAINARAKGSRFTFDYDGTNGRTNIIVDATLVSYVQNNVSDRRLKENIQAADRDVLALIDRVKFYSFDWRSNGTHEEHGVIAQQVQSVDPRWVHTPSAGEDPLKTPLGINTFALTLDLLRAVQQLSAEVKALKAAAS